MLDMVGIRVGLVEPSLVTILGVDVTKYVGWLYIVLSILISVWALYLTYQYNRTKSPKLILILAMIIAFLVPFAYLIYYFVWHTVLRKKTLI